MSQGEQRSNDGRKPDNRGVPIRAEKSPKLNHGKGSVKRPGSSHAARFPEKRNVPKLVLEACWRFVWYAIGLVGVGIMLFLCLRPSSDVRILGLPHWAIIDWADRHGEFRNFPAFFVLGLPFLVVIRRRSRRAIAIGLLAFAGMAVEIVQIWLPHRYASVMDVLWSWAGLAAVWALMSLSERTIRSVA